MNDGRNLTPRGMLSAAEYRRADFATTPPAVYLPPDAPPRRWIWYLDRHVIVGMAAGAAVILALAALLVLA